MLPVEGYKGLYRDEKSGAIINCNNEELMDYLQSKEIYTRQKIEIDNLRSEIEDIKMLLNKVVDLKDKYNKEY